MFKFLYRSARVQECMKHVYLCTHAQICEYKFLGKDKTFCITGNINTHDIVLFPEPKLNSYLLLAIVLHPCMHGRRYTNIYT